MEVNFFGGGGFPSGDIKDFSDTAGAQSGISLGLDAGFFITNNFVGGLNFTYTEMGIDDQAQAGGLHHKIYSPSLYLKYYFIGTSDFLPYVKAHGGLDFPKFATFVNNPTGNRYRELSYDPVFAYGGGLGLFVFTTDYSGLFVEANYHRAQSSGTHADYHGVDYKFNSDINMIDIHAGIRILIAPSQ
jgi:outer membrane protein W